MRARNMEDLIQRKYDELNENDKAIWNYIVMNKEVCKNISIQQLAVFCHMSHTTILRFAKKLGFSGYSEMRSFLKWEDEVGIFYEEHDTQRCSNSFIALIRKLEDMNMDDICQMVSQADTIYANGSGAIQKNAVMYMKEKFLFHNIFIYTIEGESELSYITEDAKEDDLFIFFSFSGVNQEQLKQARRAKERGCKIILIAMEGKGGFYDLADAVIEFHPEQIQSVGFEDPYYQTVYFYIIAEFISLKYLEYKTK